MSDGVLTTVAADPLVAAVQKQVTDLASGNPHSADGFSFQSSREDRGLVLTMGIGVRHRSATEILPGQVDPAESVRCKDEKAVAGLLIEAADGAAAKPDTVARITSRLRADPPRAFAETPDEFDIGVALGRWHVHFACAPCGQTGVVDCGGCGGSGREACYACDDGKRQCINCSFGRATRSEQIYDRNSGRYYFGPVTRTCNVCDGRGRVASCFTCHGSQIVRCRKCSGSGVQTCVSCGRTGWLTAATSARLVGRPVRAISFQADAPAEFRNNVAALPIADLPVAHGKVVRAIVETTEGRVGVGLECIVPQIIVEACFGPGAMQRFDAIGLLGRIPTMPVFLDPMLAAISADINLAVAGGRHAEVLRLAKETRVTCSAILAVSGRGHGLETLRAVWKGAASDAMLAGLLEDIGEAYEGAGAAAVSRFWKLLALPVVAAAAIAFPLHLGARLVAALPSADAAVARGGAVADAVAGLLPLTLALIFARRRARHALRAVIGQDVARIPRHGRWARAVAITTVVALIAGATVPEGRTTALSGAVPSLSAPTAPRPVQGSVRPAVLNPSPMPRLEPVFQMPRVRGDPDVFRLQFLLGQFGFLHGEPDGVLHRATGDALHRFDTALPPSRRRSPVNRDAAVLAEAALRGEFRLEHLPADRLPFPGLSNIARANLTGLDTVSIQGAVNRALAAPRQEVSWRSDDGVHGGRVVATFMPFGCPYLHAEVEIRGAVETVGPFPYCRNGRR